jgi:ribosomal-protein-alanine N-acetyltransferase
MPSEIRIDCGICALRTLRDGDETSLAEHGNDRDIWLKLRDRFPHPYTEDNGRAFIALAGMAEPPHHLAITMDDAVVGMIGFIPGTDIERVNAEVGYWVGRRYWKQGLLSAALPAATRYALDRFALTRVFALVFADNTPSIRLLEKCGYVREGFLKKSAIKDGVVLDQYLYGYTV